MKSFFIKRALFLASVYIIVIASLNTILPKSISNSEIDALTPKIESISYQTFQDISSKYNLLGNEDVSIKYDKEGNVEKVYEEGINQEYYITREKVNEEKLHKELELYSSAKSFYRKEKLKQLENEVGKIFASLVLFTITLVYISNSISHYNEII